MGIFFWEGGELDDEMKKIPPIFSEKLDYFSNQRWEEAAQDIERVLEKNEDAVLPLTYLESCIGF